MTFKYGKTSERRLVGVHPDLVKVFRKALSYGVLDITIVQGVRTYEEQKRLYSQGRTTPGPIVTKTMNSKHLVSKVTGYGHAIDAVPYPIDWDNIRKFYMLAGVIKSAASELGIPIRWGGDWKGFKDYPHWELIL